MYSVWIILYMLNHAYHALRRGNLINVAVYRSVAWRTSSSYCISDHLLSREITGNIHMLTCYCCLSYIWPSLLPACLQMHTRIPKQKHTHAHFYCWWAGSPLCTELVSSMVENPTLCSLRILYYLHHAVFVHLHCKPFTHTVIAW